MGGRGGGGGGGNKTGSNTGIVDKANGKSLFQPNKGGLNIPDFSSSGNKGGGGGGSKTKKQGSTSTGGIQGGGSSGGGGGGSAEAPKKEDQPTTDVNETTLPPDASLEDRFEASSAYQAFVDKYGDGMTSGVGDRFGDNYDKAYNRAFTNWVQSQGDKAPGGASPLDKFRQKDHNRRTGQDLVDDIEAVNPRHGDGDGEWDSNCQRCTMAVEFRAKGYDVTALPLTEGYQRSGYDTNGELKPPKTTFSAIGLMFTDAEGNKRDWFKTTKGDIKAKQIAQLETEIRSWPEGARGFVGIDYSAGGSHIFNVEVRDGQPYYIDGQTDVHGPDMFTAEEGAHNWKLKINPQSDMWLLRVDDLTANDKAMAWVRERSIEEKNAPTATELGAWLDLAYPPDMPGLTEEQIGYLQDAFTNGWQAVRTGQTPLMPPEYAGTIVEQAWEAGIEWARRPA